MWRVKPIRKINLIAHNNIDVLLFEVGPATLVEIKELGV